MSPDVSGPREIDKAYREWDRAMTVSERAEFVGGVATAIGLLCGVLGFRLACGVAVAIVGCAVIVRSIALDAAERALPAEEDGE